MEQTRPFSLQPDPDQLLIAQFYVAMGKPASDPQMAKILYLVSDFKAFTIFRETQIQAN